MAFSFLAHSRYRVAAQLCAGMLHVLAGQDATDESETRNPLFSKRLSAALQPLSFRRGKAKR